MTRRRVVLGIDPGMATLGYGLVYRQDDRFISPGWGVLRTAAGLPLPKRLHQLHCGLRELMDRYHPTEVAVEQLFFSRNVSTAIAVGEARGVVLLAADQSNLDVSEYTPAQVKSAVAGAGRAGKRQVQQMVRVILALNAEPRPDDAADALALAICHLNAVEFTQHLAVAP